MSFLIRIMGKLGNEVLELKILHRAERDRQKCDRIKAILMFHKGYTSVEIGEVLLIDANTVSGWKHRYLYPFQNGTRISNRDGSIFLYVTTAIWTGIRSRFHFGMGINRKNTQEWLRTSVLDTDIKLDITNRSVYVERAIYVIFGRMKLCFV